LLASFSAPFSREALQVGLGTSRIAQLSPALRAPEQSLFGRLRAAIQHKGEIADAFWAASGRSPQTTTFEQEIAGTIEIGQRHGIEQAKRLGGVSQLGMGLDAQAHGFVGKRTSGKIASAAVQQGQGSLRLPVFAKGAHRLDQDFVHAHGLPFGTGWSRFWLRGYDGLWGLHERKPQVPCGH
jgi:hypothetical protein